MDVEQLAGLVSAKVKLARKGRRWVGLCPFHEEKTPSFEVFEGRDKKARYHCHGCGEGGDAINWLRQVEGLGYGQAVKAMQGSFKRKPSAELRREKKREAALNAFRDKHPDSPLPDWAIDV